MTLQSAVATNWAHENHSVLYEIGVTVLSVLIVAVLCITLVLGVEKAAGYWKAWTTRQAP
jgi:hypothetical protein